jgi:general secretion pathway protein D
MKSTLPRRLLALLLSALLVAGCATPPALNGNRGLFDEGRTLVEAGRVEQGLDRVQAASKAEPGNNEYRAYYFRQRDAAVQRYLLAGDGLRASNRFDEAETAYKQALALDPTNARAAASVDSLQADRRHRALLVEAEELLKGGKTELAQAKVREVLIENASHRDAQVLQRKLDERSIKSQAAMPQLMQALKKPVTLEFRNAPLRSVFEIISKNSGLNFVFDRDVQPDLRTTVFVKDTSIEDVIKFVLVTSQLERKVLNENTILIYPNRADKVRDYRDTVVKTFYLANADAKQTANMIKSVVKTRDMFVDDKLNILVMRDTPEAVRMAEKLVANQDLAESEVMLEVEVLEVSTNLLEDLGVQWPTQISAGVVGAGGTPGVITGKEAKNFNSSLVRLAFGDPLVAINLKKQDGRTNVLANPRIRVKNREKARIHIGDKVPVITTTATATGFLGENVTYLDVGLKLEVEPLIYLENDVGIKVGLEVSNIAREIRSRSGTVTYQVGTRNAATSLRLKDGETQVLAGLISDEDRRNANKVPGLSDLPVLGRLFTSNSDTRNRTEIVLLITPRVVRNVARPDIRLEEFSGGTDAMLGGDPMTLQAVPGAPVPPPPGTPIPGAPAAPAPAPAPAGAPAAPAAPAAAPFGGASVQPNSVPGGPGTPAPVR